MALALLHPALVLALALMLLALLTSLVETDGEYLTAKRKRKIEYSWLFNGLH
jgi:hypothetical protein